MTRYARAGKGTTHQRVAKDPTPWDDMKPPPPERLRGSKGGDDGGIRKKKNFKKERFSRQKPQQEDAASSSSFANNDNGGSGSDGPKPHQNGNSNGNDRKFSKSSNAKVRGFGQSKSIQIFGQFWVPMEDGKRMQALVKKLKAQGVSRKEITEALKNDRRKAEKAAKRQRDKTCFQCRQFGHILSDCPNLNNAMTKRGSENEDQAADGSGEVASEICFKCGSTEHMSRHCRKKGETFSFAKCFICHGSGHIARQCPKNTRGIYPSGGSCGECGSLTHLKKDCPDLAGMEQDSFQNDEDDPNAMTLSSMADPFASTEYEPVIEKTEEEKAVDEAEEEARKEKDSNQRLRLLNIADYDNTNANNASSMKRPPPPNKKSNSKKKGKRQMNEEMDSSTFEFGLSSSAAEKPKPAVPVKRKIVKF